MDFQLFYELILQIFWKMIESTGSVPSLSYAIVQSYLATIFRADTEKHIIAEADCPTKFARTSLLLICTELCKPKSYIAVLSMVLYGDNKDEPRDMGSSSPFWIANILY